MRAGGLDRQIIIESRTIAQNTSGAPVETWATFATVWATKKDLRGEERYAAGKENAIVDTEWTIRYLTGLLHEMRINYGGVYYDITAIREIGRNEGMVISAFVRAQ